MSDSIKHECAVALLVLRTRGAVDGATKLSLLLEKQHNRGQDGAGVVTLSSCPETGKPAYNELKSASDTPLADLLGQIARRRKLPEESIFLGHLRYATYGKGDVGFCHPFVHKAARLSRTLFLAGNFNLTNTRELFDAYVDMGKFPESEADGYLICEWLASTMLKVEMEGDELGDVYQKPDRGQVIAEALKRLLPKLDGAFTLCGMTGDGWSFAVRDSHGIRPGYCLVNDDVAVVASEYYSIDVFSPNLIPFCRSLMARYREVGADGGMRDEWGFIPNYSPDLRTFFWSPNFAAAYRAEFGRDLLADLPLLACGPRGDAGRSAAIGAYMKLTLKRNVEIERDFYAANKEIFGADVYVAKHPTWFSSICPQEFFHNGLDWWQAPRDWAQSDEVSPFYHLKR